MIIKISKHDATIALKPTLSFSTEFTLKTIFCHDGNPVIQGSKQVNSECRLLEGAQESDEMQDQNLYRETDFSPGEIGESEIVCIGLYPNKWDLVNHYWEFKRW